MSTNRLVDTLMDSCDNLYKKGVIGDTGLEKCKKIKEKDIKDLNNKDVENLENKIYKDAINKHMQKSNNQYNKFKEELNSLLNEYKKIKINNIN